MDLASESAYSTPYANTSILPLLLLSLMQQKHSPKTTTTFKSEYDFIIVGSGSAGSVVASRLSEIPCVSVLLLEAGKPPPLLTDIPALHLNYLASDISWQYWTVPQKHSAKAMVNRQMFVPCGKTLGGSSIINVMLYTRGNKYDYDEWAKQGAVGWSYSDVKPYFLKLENNVEPDFLADGYHTVGGPQYVEKVRHPSELRNPIWEAAQQLGYGLSDPNGRNQTGFYDTEVTARNGQRCSTAKSYLVPAENRTNLDIVTNAFVKKVLIKDQKAEGVVFEHGGATHVVRAKREVILSAGAINSAKLLMLSGIGPRKHLKKFNIPVVADLPVGNNFQDHFGISMYYELDANIPTTEQELENKTHINDYIENRQGSLAFIGVDPVAFLTGPTNPKSDFPDFQILFAKKSTPTPNPKNGFTPELIEKYFGDYKHSNFYACFPQVLHPKSRGTVRLQSADPHDSPLIDPKYFKAPEDLQPIIDGLKLCKKIANSEPMKKVGSKLIPKPFPGCEEYFGNDDDYFECLARSRTESMKNQIGTAKMGYPNDSTSVVCPKLKVKGIEGLRVVDASIMPIIPNGNTNIPTIMIAEKASDMIKETLNCYTQTPV